MWAIMLKLRMYFWSIERIIPKRRS
jgi:hypothetical protein